MTVNEEFKLSFSSNNLDFDTNIETSEEIGSVLSSSEEDYIPQFGSLIVVNNGDGDITDEEIEQAIQNWLDKNPLPGGTTSYPELEDKPSINGVELIGNKTAKDLGLQEAGNYLTSIPDKYVTKDDIANIEVTLPDWIGDEKPTYTAEEVGADPVGTAEQKAAEAVAAAKEYTDTKTSDILTSNVVNSKISEHNTNASSHNDIRLLVSELSTAVNRFLDVDDDTTDQLSEVLELIDNNKGTLESLTVNKINVSDIIDNLITADATKPLSANQGVIIQNLIDALQTATDNLTSKQNEDKITLLSSIEANTAAIASLEPITADAITAMFTAVN